LPQVLGNIKIEKMSFKNNISSLKGAFCMLIALLAICFTSCDKNDVVEQQPTKAMELLYIESKGLPETSADSITSFAKKFCAHMNKNVEDQYDEFYQPTVDNMVYAASVFGYKLTVNVGVSIKINDEWDGEIVINF
jgi:hypothetical protein